MLRQRILTAVVLALVLVASLSWSLLAFSAVIALAAGVAMFEWLRLARLGDRVTIPAGAVFGALLLLAQATMPGLMAAAAPVLCGLAVAGWIAIGALLVRAQTRGVQVGPMPLVLLAVLFLLAAWAALQNLLAGGAVELLSAMAIVWLADIAAYFFGRTFGRSKLASRISPGKTWAGAWGALGAVIVVAFLARSAWPAAPLVTNDIIGAAGALVAAGLFVLLVAASIVGDLFESLLKRQAGVKDSSRLLPGHGGVLDRIDALLPVLPLVVLIQRWAG